MRRIVIILVLLIASAGMAPKAVGFLVADQQARLAGTIAGRLRGVEISVEQSDGGWFTTRTRHRLRVTDPASALLIADLTGRPLAEGSPAIMVDSVIAHGPWPLFKGRAGIARMHSRLWIDMGGEAVPVPGSAVTDIAFDGSGTTSMDFQRMDTTVRGGASVLMWDGARMTIDFDAGLERIESSGRVGSLTMLGPQGELRMGEVSLDGVSTATRFGFWSGSSRLSISGLSVTGVDGSRVEAEAFSLAIDVTVEDESVGHAVELDIDALRSDDIDLAAIRMSASTEGLAAAAIGRLGQAESAGAMEWLEVMRPGSALRVEELSIRNDGGELRFQGHCEVPGDAAPSGGPAERLRTLVGQARLTVTPGMLGGDADARTAPLVAAGYLKRSGDGTLVSQIRIGSGLVTVNGLPIPLILPR